MSPPRASRRILPAEPQFGIFGRDRAASLKKSSRRRGKAADIPRTALGAAQSGLNEFRQKRKGRPFPRAEILRGRPQKHNTPTRGIAMKKLFSFWVIALQLYCFAIAHAASVEEMQRAAEQGDALAQNALGTM